MSSGVPQFMDKLDEHDKEALVASIVASMIGTFAMYGMGIDEARHYLAHVVTCDPMWAKLKGSATVVEPGPNTFTWAERRQKGGDGGN